MTQARVHLRLPAKRPGYYDPPWLLVIHQVNRDEPGTFGAPAFVERSDVLVIENYPDADVIHRKDETVSLVAKTDKGDRLLAAAAKALGHTWSPTSYGPGITPPAIGA